MTDKTTKQEQTNDKDSKQTTKITPPKGVPTQPAKPFKLPPQHMMSPQIRGGGRAMQAQKSPRKR